jgi:hypothetical protein
MLIEAIKIPLKFAWSIIMGDWEAFLNLVYALFEVLYK